MGRVYTGQQTYAEFLFLCRQSLLFSEPISDQATVKRRLEALAVHVVSDLGPDANWADLKDTLKSRAAGKVRYDSALAVAALETALRTRGQAVK